MFPALGDAMDDYAGGDPLMNAYAGDPALAQLHQIALIIVALRQQWESVLNAVANADSTVDPTALTDIATEIQQEVVIFGQTRAQVNAQTAKLYDLSPIDNAILDVGNWANGMLGILKQAGGAVLNLPTDIANYVAQQLANIAKAAADAAHKAAMAALMAILPVVAIAGVALLLFVGQAEKTRTYRKLVA